MWVSVSMPGVNRSYVLHSLCNRIAYRYTERPRLQKPSSKENISQTPYAEQDLTSYRATSNPATAIPNPKPEPAFCKDAAPVLTAAVADGVREALPEAPEPDAEAEAAAEPEGVAEPEAATDPADAVGEPDSVDEPDGHVGAVFTLMFAALHS
jgi:hypothetical protein